MKFYRVCPNCSKPVMLGDMFKGKRVVCMKCHATISKPFSDYSGIASLGLLFGMVIHNLFPSIEGNFCLSLLVSILLILVTVVPLLVVGAYFFIPLSVQPEQDSTESKGSKSLPED